MVHVITGLRSGGAERMLTRLVADRASGFDHVVVSLTDEGFYGQILRENSISVYSLGLTKGIMTPGVIFVLARLLRGLRPDVVSTWLYHADLVGTLAALMANIALRRVVWNLRCSDMEFRRYKWSMRMIVRALAILSRLPNAIVSNSRAGVSAHQALGYRPRRWICLPNGFDLAVWRPDTIDRNSVRAELSLSDVEIAIGLVGRNDPQKDHATFFGAAARIATLYPGVRFVLIGQGTEAILKPDGWGDAVLALGERRDVPRLLRGLDILVMCSRYGEGFPNVVGEAMATGLPCIVTAVGDSAEIVGSAGCCVPPGDVDALAAAMEKLVTAGSDTRVALGARGRERIANRYDLCEIRAQYHKLWGEIAQQ